MRLGFSFIRRSSQTWIANYCDVDVVVVVVVVADDDDWKTLL
jgi:hypothetical protein